MCVSLFIFGCYNYLFGTIDLHNTLHNDYNIQKLTNSVTFPLPTVVTKINITKKAKWFVC